MLCTLLPHVQSSKGYSYLFLSCVIWGCFSSNLLLRRNPLFSSKIVARRSAVRYQEIGAAQTARPGGRAWCGALLCAVIFGAEQVKRRGGKPLSSRVTPLPNWGDACHVTMSDAGSAATTVPTPDLRRLENATEERETCAVPRGRRWGSGTASASQTQDVLKEILVLVKGGYWEHYHIIRFPVVFWFKLIGGNMGTTGYFPCMLDLLFIAKFVFILFLIFAAALANCPVVLSNYDTFTERENG